MTKYDILRKRDNEEAEKIRIEIKQSLLDDVETKEELIKLAKDFNNPESKYKLFKMLSEKIDGNADKLARLWFLDWTKDWAYAEEVLSENDETLK